MSANKSQCLIMDEHSMKMILVWIFGGRDNHNVPFASERDYKGQSIQYHSIIFQYYSQVILLFKTIKTNTVGMFNLRKYIYI